MGKFTLIKNEGKARRGRFETVHGTIETPVFMNVGTSAAIKGGVSTMDDVRALRRMNVYGAIIGRAYYIGAIDLKEAIEVSV